MKNYTAKESLIRRIRENNKPFSYVDHDKDSDTWFFCCDPFGAVPLFFAFRDGTPVFSDTIRDLRNRLGHPLAFREDLLEIYLSFSYLPGEDTFFSGVKKALPGYLYEYRDGVLSRERYFTPVYSFDKTKNLEQWTAELSGILDDICAEEKKGITALLSSGIDSYYLCTRLQAKRTYTVSYPNQAASEAPTAREHANRIGSDHHEVEVTPDLFFLLADDAMKALDQPSGDASAPVLLALARKISETENTCYSGEGIDEMFMGYYYRDLNSIPDDISLTEAEYLGCTQGFHEEEKKRILKHYSGTEKMSITKEAYTLSAGESRLDQAALVDMLVWMGGNLLPNIYAVGKACGLHFETPYLDRRLYEISLRMPASVKNDRKLNKIVFRKAVETALGAENSMQPKKGFPVPITAWLKRPESAVLVKEALSSATAEKFFNTGRLTELYDNFLNDSENRYSWRPVWCLYSFIIWYRHAAADLL